MSIALRAMLTVSVLLVLLAALPNGVTYRISPRAGRSLGSARLPLFGFGLAIMIGVGIGLFVGGA